MILQISIFIAAEEGIITMSSVSTKNINETDEIFFISTTGASNISGENVSFVISTTKYSISG